MKAAYIWHRLIYIEPKTHLKNCKSMETFYTHTHKLGHAFCVSFTHHTHTESLCLHSAVRVCVCVCAQTAILLLHHLFCLQPLPLTGMWPHCAQVLQSRPPLSLSLLSLSLS